MDSHPVSLLESHTPYDESIYQRALADVHVQGAATPLAFLSSLVYSLEVVNEPPLSANAAISRTTLLSTAQSFRICRR